MLPGKMRTCTSQYFVFGIKSDKIQDMFASVKPNLILWDHKSDRSHFCCPRRVVVERDEKMSCALQRPSRTTADLLTKIHVKTLNEPNCPDLEGMLLHPDRMLWIPECPVLFELARIRTLEWCELFVFWLFFFILASIQTITCHARQNIFEALWVYLTYPSCEEL